MNLLEEFPEKGTLSAAEEQKLAGRKTDKAKQKLVMHAMREAFYYLSGLSRGHVPPGEIVSISYEALTRASKNYQARGVRFFAYCKPHLRGALSRYRQKLNTVPYHASAESGDDMASRVAAMVNEFPDGQELSEQELATGGLVVESCASEIDIRDRWGIVKTLLPDLNEQERAVIELRYFSGYNLAEIGRLLGGASRQAIAHTLARALRKLRSKLLWKKQLYETQKR